MHTASTLDQGIERIGLYGGAFDPPHLAHAALARCAIEQHGLDRLIVMPTGQAWHKSRGLTDAAHRIEMTKLAFADVPLVQVDVRETLRSGPSYTVDTLLQLRGEYLGAQLFVLMGQDQFDFLPQWHRYEEILQVATVLVALRADSMLATGSKGLKNQAKILHSPIHMAASPISASLIRELCLQNQTIDHLVKPSVARYIAQHRLYTSF